MKILAILLISMGALLAGASFYFQTQFMLNGSTIPNAAQGRIYEQNIRGKTVYLTKIEHYIENWMFGSACLAWMGGGLLFERSRPKNGLPGSP